jgi:alkylation response protein AidB-like acyl-CoA dehydrogenase
VDLQAVNALVNQAIQLLQIAWEHEHNLTPEQRGECMIAVNRAKVAATKVSLDITNRIFEVMGAQATSQPITNYQSNVSIARNELQRTNRHLLFL